MVNCPRIEDHLSGANHIIVVPDGALQSLPFSLLIERRSEDTSPTTWLADRYAFTTVPSVSALRALRYFTRLQKGSEPFIGYGDPVLNGEEGDQRRLSVRTIFKSRTKDVSGVAVADVIEVRQSMPLPETADELKMLAMTLNATEDSIYLQDRATETNLKSIDLTRYK